MAVLRHAEGLTGSTRALALALTPVLIPLWILGWLAARVYDAQEWWWTR
jgi:hypothetical protein